jgi:hypothetical protein
MNNIKIRDTPESSTVTVTYPLSLYRPYITAVGTVNIQVVPLATEPGISLIILPLMRILVSSFFYNAQMLDLLGEIRTYSCSNFVAISSFVLELIKKCRVR